MREWLGWRVVESTRRASPVLFSDSPLSPSVSDETIKSEDGATYRRNDGDDDNNNDGNRESLSGVAGIIEIRVVWSSWAVLSRIQEIQDSSWRGHGSCVVILMGGRPVRGFDDQAHMGAWSIYGLETSIWTRNVPGCVAPEEAVVPNTGMLLVVE